jgi:microcystin-dependent protein
LSIGEIVYLTTTGALPTGLSANTQYFVAATSFATNTFTLTASYGGSAINTSGTQSGTHTLTSCPYGFASSTNFYVPDMRGRVPMGAGTGAQNGGSGSGAISGGTSLTARVRGVFGGDERLQTHTHVQNAHTHTQNAHAHDLGGGQSFGMNFGGNGGAGATFAVAVADINCGTYQGPYSANSTTATNQSTTATNQNAGSGSSENMPPFVVINYIIKT